ncbi:TPA: VasL domain-containing protein [Klebsiella michiganensis]|uniref:VasL domain-containing protein n=1 Tax=Klebsiella michiganensis TaxID=1134687 RepID=UPI00277BA0A9|nr:type VI secretion system ImpA family N-terminal domain-containing protein [Klebsiella michiganensis]HDS8619477.1 type VI secretion system ImpA family N-terminal domain-containing protein [Klebsiella michiganensis]HED2509412.1 type VI secretion system ImpA family N-terminal domain-containing protein [Klebsiella michiganensis]
MTTFSERYLKTGGDPRTLADYAALRDEMNKLIHPARPDVNWPHVEKLCLSLFEHNGVELQTAAWYTFARTQIAGVYGLNEGLALLEALIACQWNTLWPQPVAVRMEILSTLSKRLQQAMRTQLFACADLGALYRAEQYLKTLGEVLQRLELKQVSQFEPLQTLIHNAAVRLESADSVAPFNSDSDTLTGKMSQVGEAEPVRMPSVEPSGKPAGNVRWIYVAQPEPQQNVEVVRALPPARRWKPFIVGMFTMLLVGGSTVWDWLALNQPDPAEVQLMASLRPLPVTVTHTQLQSLRGRAMSPDAGISETQQQLARLARLPPDWNIDYGNQVVQQALTLWPEQAGPLATQWQQRVSAAALPADNLNGWHQGMAQLQHLANQLNALDEKRGKYMTVSELKSVVFSMTQAFSSAVPVEEQLRLMAQPDQTSPDLQRLTEMHLEQLTARYALLKQKTPE